MTDTELESIRDEVMHKIHEMLRDKGVSFVLALVEADPFWSEVIEGRGASFVALASNTPLEGNLFEKALENIDSIEEEK